MSIDGILNVLKPGGRTSSQVVSLIRRLSGERRVGHAGTLDPEATGVLVVCLGQGTRVAEFLAHDTKVYRAEIELGVTTDTYDSSGEVIQRSDPFAITEEQLKGTLHFFRGNIEQIPPMYSALKHEGKRLYELARLGIEVARKPRKVRISHLELVEWQPPMATVEVECSAGTYIRSLAQDIGVVLGCGACLSKLVRLRSGLFDIAEAMDIASMEEAFCHGYWRRFLYPIDEVLLDWKAAIVSQESESAIKEGRSVFLADRDSCDYPPPEDQCRAYSAEGRFIAVLRPQPGGGMWHPDKVFAPRSQMRI